MTTQWAFTSGFERDNVDQGSLYQFPQELINEVSKVLDFVGVTPLEKAELAASQLKYVSQIWFG